MTDCTTCKRVNRDCPIAPQPATADTCVEYRIDGCKARQYSDQMQCARCGLAWDVNDSDRPACLTKGVNV